MTCAIGFDHHHGCVILGRDRQVALYPPHRLAGWGGLTCQFALGFNRSSQKQACAVYNIQYPVQG